jgi:hypothetical protein
MSCLTCHWFSGDPENEFGWCYAEQQATNIKHTCEFWLEPCRIDAETGAKLPPLGPAPEPSPEVQLIINCLKHDRGEEV